MVSHIKDIDPIVKKNWNMDPLDNTGSISRHENEAIFVIAIDLDGKPVGVRLTHPRLCGVCRCVDHHDENCPEDLGL